MKFSKGCSREDNNGEASPDHSKMVKKRYQRHTPYQIQRLEEYFKDCDHPNNKQRRELSDEVGLDPEKIKFWFQNKRTQIKAQNDRDKTNALRAENERIKFENFSLGKRVNNAICKACLCLPHGKEQRQAILQQLQIENRQLNIEINKIYNTLPHYIGIPISQIPSLTPISDYFPLDSSIETLLGQGMEDPSPNNRNSNRENSNDPVYAYQLRKIQGSEKLLMLETAINAANEIFLLSQYNEPLWVKDWAQDRHVLHRESYKRIFPKISHLKSFHAMTESSKDEGKVRMDGRQLVEMLLDSDKWVGLFPTMVTKAKIVEDIQLGMQESQHGCLKLMYGKMHILSPMVEPREFFFLRYCAQINPGMWVVADVSYDCFEDNKRPAHFCSWRHPSGCVIQDMSNGSSKVTWMEHIEVDDKTQHHQLYRDLMSSGLLYGAERLLLTLQRTCERFSYSMIHSLSPDGLKSGGRKSIMNLSEGMIKNFCACLEMKGKIGFPCPLDFRNDGVQLLVRKSLAGEPDGIIVTAATSLWLPFPYETVFNFFNDHEMRPKWDVLTCGKKVQEILSISYGTHPGNRIAVIQPFVPSEKDMLILQETRIDPLGSVVAYAPIDTQSLGKVLTSTEDVSYQIPVLASGFIISSDGRPNVSFLGASSSSGISSTNSRSACTGSLVTAAFEILVSSELPSSDFEGKLLAKINALVWNTVYSIKDALFRPPPPPSS